MTSCATVPGEAGVVRVHFVVCEELAGRDLLLAVRVGGVLLPGMPTTVRRVLPPPPPPPPAPAPVPSLFKDSAVLKDVAPARVFIFEDQAKARGACACACAGEGQSCVMYGQVSRFFIHLHAFVMNCYRPCGCGGGVLRVPRDSSWPDVYLYVHVMVGGCVVG